MTPAIFNRFLKQLQNLTDSQAKQVEKHLLGKDPSAEVINELQQRMVETPECPHCQGDQIKRHGKSGEMQRYRCKGCLKTFTATTRTPLAHLRNKEKWLRYFSCMIEGESLRKSAEECGINLKTSFRWRHRFLQMPASMKAACLEGIVEIDETLFARSEKGKKDLNRAPRKRGMRAKKRGRSSADWVPVLTVRDRGKHTYEAVLGAVTTQALNLELKDKIEKDSVLCSDGFRSYIKFADTNNLIHKRLNISAGIQVIDKVFHIQNVNAYHSRLKQWMARFHGIATKYLEHYLGWFRFLDQDEKPNKNNLFKAQQHLAGT